MNKKGAPNLAKIVMHDPVVQSAALEVVAPKTWVMIQLDGFDHTLDEGIVMLKKRHALLRRELQLQIRALSKKERGS